MRRKSERGARGHAVVCSAVAAFSIACGKKAGEAEQAPLPFTKFEIALELEPKPGTPRPAPPAVALRPWHVWINQEVPRQKKNPLWKSFPAKDGAELQLEAGGHWRCLIDPARVYGKADEDGSVAHWTASRSVRCSTDGFTTHVQALLQLGYSPEGEATPSEASARLLLRDTVDGKPRETTVLLRGLEPKRY